jgi:dihydrofolate reductase
MSGPVVSIIVAVARNGVIGIGNALPWHLPEDLKHFKSVTMGHHIVMGRKTYESIGRPLPGRTTVIVSRDPAHKVEGCLSAPSPEAAIALCEGDDEIFFVGGANLYAQALGLAQRLYLTEIQADFEGDAYFPGLDRTVWREVSRQHRVGASGLAFDFVLYER